VLTVPEAARRVGRNPETVRRWIREGKLPARKVGNQHVIEDEALQAAASPARSIGIPEAWKTLASGRPLPDPVPIIRADRDGR
jgi:excisionase family DNA binding protein